ncbi:MAG: putative selenium-dependent hydroxylase accessory protein YqeC [Spirochaetes bacterium]|nr:putative selenium-dependent hydroxylase accessory protein YqeC [Spirochaetota bacterium]MBU1080168.1 putative selenium-dependent hydroxylase accessory protein YqeC [Spirochaetota bacterium]
MTCLEMALPTIGPRRRPAVVSVVGAGGKTSLVFALASEARAAGLEVLVTTTTRIRDPRGEGRGIDAFLADASWRAGGTAALPSASEARSRSGALPAVGTLGLAGTAGLSGAGLPRSGFVAALGSGVDAGKLGGISPALVGEAEGWDLIIVEADGARGLSLKAPADHEPVIPASSDVVVAVIGLDCLGRPLGDAIAFRPELVARLAGIRIGDAIRPADIAALASSPLGCFKLAPPTARRVLALNKADAAPDGASAETASSAISAGAADMVVVASFREASAGARIRSYSRP